MTAALVLLGIELFILGAMVGVLLLDHVQKKRREPKN